MSIRRGLVALLLALAGAFLAAQGKGAGDASVTFSWRAVEGAGGYTVELASLSGESVASVTVEGTTATISAPPGDYNIRIVSLNHFMRPESASPWKRISIVRKGKPQAESLDPQFIEPGLKSELVIKGKNLDASTSVALRRAGEAAIHPLSVRALDASRLEIILPPIEVGIYSIELLNKPDYSLVLPLTLTVRHKPAVIASVEPSSLDLTTTPLRFTVVGSGIAPGASVRLEIGGKRVDLSSITRTDSGLSAELSGEPEEGTYDLVIENDALSITRASSALHLFRPAPQAAQAVVAPTPEPASEPVPEPPLPPEPAPVPAPQAETAPAPPPNVSPATTAPTSPAKVAFSLPPEPWSLDAGWSTSFALDKWSALFPPSFANADLSARLCFSQSRARRIDAELRLGTELRANASFLSSKPGDATYVSSSLSSFGLQAGAWLELAWPRFETTIRMGAGATYSIFEVSGANLPADAKTQAYSIDPAASIGVECAWRATSRLSLGLRGTTSIVFFSDLPLIVLSPGAFAKLAF
jgi:hypothetical protein